MKLLSRIKALFRRKLKVVEEKPPSLEKQAVSSRPANKKSRDSTEFLI